MQKFTFLIGISGAGKSTYANQHVDSNTLYLSSDQLREDLYGSLEEGNKHNGELFEYMNKTAIRTLKKTDKDVLYDATNLNRKNRQHLYNLIKRIPDVQVESHIVFKDPETAKQQNQQRTGYAVVPDDVIERQFMTFQIPRVGLDTDIITSSGDSWFTKIKETEMVTHDTVPVMSQHAIGNVARMIEMNNAHHDTPYHLESINEHIQMVVDTTLDEQPQMLLTAAFHDLGKGYVKNRGRNHSGHYIHHELVSAQYMLNYMLNNEYDNYIDKPVDSIELVYQHMNGHQLDTINMSKFQKKHHLSDEFIHDLSTFAEIDSKARIVDIQMTDLQDENAMQK